MGGNAFPTPAQRLTTAQLDKLSTHVAELLRPIFPLTAPLRAYTTKETHGDLDLVCAWEGMGVLHDMRGAESGGVNYEYMQTGKVAMRDFCESVAAAVGAVRWKRNGAEISCAVPVTSVFPELHLEGRGDMQPFYQVDLLLVPPACLLFTQFEQSYSAMPLLLAAALRRISKQLTIHSTFLSVRYSPFFGLPPVEVILTTDVRELCSWAGLDYERWNNGFAAEEEFWTWFTSPPGYDGPHHPVLADGSLDSAEAADSCSDNEVADTSTGKAQRPAFVYAWKKFGRSQLETKSSHRNGLEILTHFRDWMQRPGTRWYSETPPPSTESPSDLTSLGTESDASLSNSSCTPVPPEPNKSLVDPFKPLELDRGASDAIEYFGKTSEWLAQLEQRRQRAQVLYDQQQERLMRKKQQQERLAAGETMSALSADSVSTASVGGTSVTTAETGATSFVHDHESIKSIA